MRPASPATQRGGSPVGGAGSWPPAFSKLRERRSSHLPPLPGGQPPQKRRAMHGAVLPAGARTRVPSGASGPGYGRTHLQRPQGESKARRWWPSADPPSPSLLEHGPELDRGAALLLLDRIVAIHQASRAPRELQRRERAPHQRGTGSGLSWRSPDGPAPARPLPLIAPSTVRPPAARQPDAGCIRKRPTCHAPLPTTTSTPPPGRGPPPPPLYQPKIKAPTLLLLLAVLVAYCWDVWVAAAALAAASSSSCIRPLQLASRRGCMRTAHCTAHCRSSASTQAP